MLFYNMAWTYACWVVGVEWKEGLGLCCCWCFILYCDCNEIFYIESNKLEIINLIRQYER